MIKQTLWVSFKTCIANSFQEAVPSISQKPCPGMGNNIINATLEFSFSDA